MPTRLIRRPSTLRSRSLRSTLEGWSSCETMSSIPQSPSIKTVSTHRERDTGFPESFCGHGNTSLRHPDARVGPDACITAEDIPVSRALTRERRSFLGSKYNKRTISHGKLLPQQEAMARQQNTVSAMYSDSAILDSDAESPTLTSGHFMPSSRAPSYGLHFSRGSKDSLDGCRSSSSAHEGRDGAMNPPGSPSSTSTSRSRGFLRRLRWNRD